MTTPRSAATAVSEISGSRTQGGVYQTAIYRRPPDLIDVDLGQFSDALKGKSIRGRVDGRKFVPYFARADIVDSGALTSRGLELAWAAEATAVSEVSSSTMASHSPTPAAFAILSSIMPVASAASTKARASVAVPPRVDDDAFARRDLLGHAYRGDGDPNDAIVPDRAHIQRLRAGDVGIFKGDAWPGREGRGCVHRSPPHTPGEPPRILLTLEALET